MALFKLLYLFAELFLAIVSAIPLPVIKNNDGANISQPETSPNQVQPDKTDWRNVVTGTISIIVGTVVPIGIHLLVKRNSSRNSSQPQGDEPLELREINGIV